MIRAAAGVAGPSGSVVASDKLPAPRSADQENPAAADRYSVKRWSAGMATAALVGVLSCAPTAGAAELVVGFKDGVSNAEQRASLPTGVARSSAPIPEIDARTITIPDSQVAQVTAQLRASGDVLYIQQDRPVRAAWTPNDPLFGSQWALTAIDADSAWDVTTGAGSPLVAVVDTGVDYTQQDLTGRVDLGYDFVDSDSDPMDEEGHGTHVSGIVAASANNGIGIAGVAPGARILAVRVLDENGSGWASDVALGIIYAADHGAKVINLSLGSDSGSNAEHDAIKYAIEHGAIVTCAAGNDGHGTLSYPGHFPECVAVGATDTDNSRATFSNWGTNLDVVAPGVGILSSVPGNTYESWNGTSMATPVVSGVAALLAGEGLGPEQIEAAIEDSATDLGSAGYDTTFGHGLVNANAAVALATSGNAAPHCVGLDLTVVEDSSGQVATNCTDVEDGSSLTIQLASAPQHGSASVVGSNLTYTPNADVFGGDSFTYRAIDSDGTASSPRTVNVTITGVNDAPHCSATPIVVHASATGVITVVCSDPDGDSPWISIAHQGRKGTLGLLGDLTLEYAAGAATGTDVVPMSVTDGTATVSVSASVQIDAAPRLPRPTIDLTHLFGSRKCGAKLNHPCARRISSGIVLAGHLSVDGAPAPSKLTVRLARKVGRRWVAAGSVTGKVSHGAFKVKVPKRRLKRGLYRVQINSAGTFATSQASSKYRYVRLR